MSKELLFGLVAIVPITFIVIAFKLYRSYTKGCTESVMGEIDHVSSNYRYHASTEDARYSYNSYYGFDYMGQHYVVRGHSTWDDVDNDGRIEIFIDPSNPQKHYRKADLKTVYLFGGLGIAMLVIMLYLFFTL